MEELRDKLEYAVRFGLQNSGGNLPRALNVAQAKFKAIVDRAPHAEEVREMQMLVQDIHSKQQEQQGIPSVVGLD